MRISTISVTSSRTLAIPTHGQAHLAITLAAEAEAGDDIRTGEELGLILATLWQMARASVRQQGEDLLNRRPA